MKPLDLVNTDARTWDILVIWPDGTIGRPVISMIGDVATRKILGYIIDRTESSDSYRKAFAKVVAEYGIPKAALFDNTRAAANHTMTAGSKNRHRFKRDPGFEGILTKLQCNVVFTTPYSGQSKPIERAFRELKERSEKHPDLAGAYTGHTPMHKPANYGERAVPVALFESILRKAVDHYNSRTDRRGKVLYGKSADAAFEDGLATTVVRKLTAAQHRVFFLVPVERKASKGNGTITLGKEPHANSYWTDALQDWRGQTVVVRYDPDDYKQPVMVEEPDGRLIAAEVPLVKGGGFNNADEARAHRRAKGAAKKATKQRNEAERIALQIEAGQHMPATPAVTSSPSAPVVAPTFGKAAPRAANLEKSADVAAIRLEAIEGLESLLGSRLNHSQKATRVARATAERKFLASLS